MRRSHGWVRNLLVAVLAATIALLPYAAGRRVPLLAWVDFAVHETGHLLAGWMPSLVMFMAGSVAEVCVPLAVAVYFASSQRDLAAGGLCLAWSGAAAWSVSIYAGDAVRQSLPIIGGEHDWAYILGSQGFDALPATETVSRSIEIGGMALAAAGVVMAAWATVSAANGVSYSVPERASYPVSFGSDDADPWRAASRRSGEAA